MKRFLLWLVPLTLITFYIQADESRSLGNVEFETSCDSAAQTSFESGLTLLHHMMYQEAEKRFQAAAGADPECAIAYWGVAMTKIHPLWGQPPSDAEFSEAQEATLKARAATHKNNRESIYLKTMAAVFDENNRNDYARQLRAFEQGFAEAHEQLPKDVDAAAFHALGMLATVDKSDATLAKQKQAGAMLDALRPSAPLHPGLFHYAIHAYDHPRLADRAAKVANDYDRIAPNVPHALHMPSHIFVREGQWDRVVEWNQRSAEAALETPVGGRTSLHYMHALDYLAYAYLQKGQVSKATEVMEDILAVRDYQPAFPSAYAVAAVPARIALETGSWALASGLKLPAPNRIDWEAFPQAAANTHFAKGIGAARANEIVRAQEAIAALRDIQSDLQERDEMYWAKLANAQENAIAAWVALAQGDKQSAVELMEQAADEEDALDKHPVTPGPILPARELLAEMWLQLGDPEKALGHYQRSLDLSPNRSRSLLGAATAAERTGDPTQARQFYARVNANFEEADPDYAMATLAREKTAAGVPPPPTLNAVE